MCLETYIGLLVELKYPSWRSHGFFPKNGSNHPISVSKGTILHTV